MSKMYKITWIILILLWNIFITSTASAELKLESVYPSLGVLGQELEVTLKGSGFDEHTRVLMYLDAGNKMTVMG